jgi:hypothetical protein
LSFSLSDYAAQSDKSVSRETLLSGLGDETHNTTDIRSLRLGANARILRFIEFDLDIAVQKGCFRAHPMELIESSFHSR